MTDVTEAAAETPDAPAAAGESAVSAVSAARASDLPLFGIAVVALVVGAGVTAAAYFGAFALLVATAVVQALLAVGWVYGTGMPGRRGALVLGGLAAAGADVSVSLFPDARLGALVAVLGLAVPAAFVHQLLRGAARVQLVSSLSAVAVLVLAQIAVASVLQLRHELDDRVGLLDGAVAGRAAAAVAAAAFVAVAVGAFVDMIAPVPRFDPSVPRGMIALVVSAAVGAAAAQLALRDVPDFAEGRGAFLGAAIGALAGLLAVAASFVLHTTPRGSSRVARLGRPVFAAILPVCVLAPAAFLLCLAVRT